MHIEGKTAYVKVMERGSFRTSPSLKKFSHAAIRKNVELLVLDLRDCVGMDSTFMGVVAGLAIYLRRQNSGRIILGNLSNHLLHLLTTLGLDQLVEIHMAGKPYSPFDLPAHPPPENLTELDASNPSQRETAEIMLEAHQNLVDASPANKSKFQDVLTFLKEDLQRNDFDGLRAFEHGTPQDSQNRKL